MGAMHVSKKSDYAMRAMAYLASQPEGHFVLAGRVALNMSVPSVFLSKIMKQMVEAGLVTSRSGPGGGYALARPASQINFREVLEAVEGPVQLVPCQSASSETCAIHDHCSQLQVWDAIRLRFVEILQGYTLDTVRTRGRGSASEVVLLR
jgi:Rrf2 family protein